jgi:hypothetical protein
MMMMCTPGPELILLTCSRMRSQQLFLKPEQKKLFKLKRDFKV